jgi:hypothetical protein
MDINRNNYESFFLLYLDRELVPEDMKVVEKFLSENADLRKEFAILQQTIQLPVNIVFDQKESLFRREDKRRIVPMYWMRIAAAAAILILGGWLIKTRILKNNTGEVAGISQPVEPIKNPAVKPASGSQGAVIHIAMKNQPEVSVRKKKAAPGYHRVPDSQYSKTKEVQDETKLATLKSGPRPELQSGVTEAGSGYAGTSPLSGIPTPVLQISAVKNENQIKNEQVALKEQEVVSDDAISIVALNDRNKSITGFFKKLVSRPPVEDNTRKVRVSVFQISY